jgi:hypothetical protein
VSFACRRTSPRRADLGSRFTRQVRGGLFSVKGIFWEAPNGRLLSFTEQGMHRTAEVSGAP